MASRDPDKRKRTHGEAVSTDRVSPDTTSKNSHITSTEEERHIFLDVRYVLNKIIYNIDKPSNCGPWISKMSDEYDRWYWYHEDTRETTWLPPWRKESFLKKLEFLNRYYLEKSKHYIPKIEKSIEDNKIKLETENTHEIRMKIKVSEKIKEYFLYFINYPQIENIEESFYTSSRYLTLLNIQSVLKIVFGQPIVISFTLVISPEVNSTETQEMTETPADPEIIHRISENSFIGKCDCSICQDEDATKSCIELGCKHTFHTECIVPWLRRKDNCPNCREKVK